MAIAAHVAAFGQESTLAVLDRNPFGFRESVRTLEAEGRFQLIADLDADLRGGREGTTVRVFADGQVLVGGVDIADDNDNDSESENIGEDDHD